MNLRPQDDSIETMPGTGALLLAGFSPAWSSLCCWCCLQLTRLGFLIRSTIPDRPRRRMFIASVSFLITFLGCAAAGQPRHAQHGPFQWVMVRGRHIHHLVWGILILLLVGYGWLLDLGARTRRLSIFFSRLMSVELRRGRGAYSGRVCSLAEPGARCLLVARPAASASTRSSSSAASWPWAHGARHSSAALQMMWARRVWSLSQGAHRDGLIPYSPRAVASSA